VLLVAADRVQPLDIDAADLAKTMQGLGLGTAALLRAAAGKAQPRIAP